MLPIAAYGLFRTLVMGSCDPKFGCIGTFNLIVQIGGIFCFVSMVCMILVKLLTKTDMVKIPAFIGTLLLALIHQYTLKLSFLHSTLDMVLYWVAVSALTYYVSALLIKKYNKAIQQ